MRIFSITVRQGGHCKTLCKTSQSLRGPTKQNPNNDVLRLDYIATFTEGPIAHDRN